MIIDKMKNIKILYNLVHPIRQIYSDRVRLAKYINADNVKLHVNKKNSKKKYLIFEYKGNQGLMAQMVGVLTWVKYAIENDYILVVDMTDNSNMYQMSEENAWENFYYQPMIPFSADSNYIKQIKENENYAICPLVDRAAYLWNKNYVDKKYIEKWPPTIVHPSTRDYKDDPVRQSEFERLYQQYIKFKPEVESYLREEYETLIKTKTGGVLGVIVRGTDYTAQKPYMHPIQPTIEMIMEKVEALKSQNLWSYIYLATDEKEVERVFEERYPGCIITNKRQYYESDDYNKLPLRMIHIERENDNILRGLEYLSSMHILSKCDILVGGLCGGSQAAILMNEGKYKEIFLFDLGNYGIDN